MPSGSKEVPGIAESWRIFTSNVRPRRLLQEDYGVRGPLWFGSEPTSPLHTFANILRLFFAIIFCPIYFFIPCWRRPSKSDIINRILWSTEWAESPEAVLLESPGSLIEEQGKVKAASMGRYAVTGNKPRWLLEVKFHGTEIVSQRQVRYEWEGEKGDDFKQKSTPTSHSLRKDIQQLGYTAISYAMSSAESLIPASGYRLDSDPEILPNGKRKYSLRDRQTIVLALLNEYARARKSINSKEDGFEFIWLDEFCLAEEKLQNEQEIRRERNIELGRLADIFRNARRVVVFCHVEDCDHTGINCPWASRLFTMGEILYASEVLQMTRTKEFDDKKNLSSFITVRSGAEFRSDMQACAEMAKQWHLYNIMQHATNSGAVTWQSAIHSLIIAAIRRDDTDKFYDHKFLGRALNGLLPRRSQPEDLRGANGWADLAWLLELNQGYYNATMLAAVCKLADNDVKEYRWWGKPISPKEGTERLEALVHAIPVSFRTAPDRSPEPILSVVGPQSMRLSHSLQRDSAGLYRNPEMRSLLLWASRVYGLLITISLIVTVVSSPTGVALLYIVTIAFTVLKLLVGTMFVDKEGWVVIEDHTAQCRDGRRWLQLQDPTFDKAIEWGARQLIPEWDTPHTSPTSPPGTSPHPYAVTLIDLRTRMFTKAAVMERPNCMVPLAIHGSGVTCILLDRNETTEAKPTTAVKVGMANLPPFVLAQAEKSGTIYIGSHWEEPVPRHAHDSTLLPLLSSPSGNEV